METYWGTPWICLTSSIQTLSSMLYDSRRLGITSNLSLIQKLIYEKLEIKIYVYQGLQCKNKISILVIKLSFNPKCKFWSNIFCREVGCSMDSLKFAVSWRGGVQGAKTQVKVGGLQLEGCSFDGARLSENQRDSPSVSAVPPCQVAWIPKVSLSCN